MGVEIRVVQTFRGRYRVRGCNDTKRGSPRRSLAMSLTSDGGERRGKDSGSGSLNRDLQN